MSSVVKAVGNAVSSVVKGVVNVVKSVASGVGDLAKSIASSPIGKAILIAGAVYFGGAALAGGFGSSAAGGSFLSGMGAGVSSAASTLSSAWGSVLAGNVGEAASAVGNAWGTAGTAAGQAAGTGAMTVGSAVAPGTVGAPSATIGAPTAGTPTAAINGGVSTSLGTAPGGYGIQSANTIGANLGTGVAGQTGSLLPASLQAPVTSSAPGFFSSDLAKYGAITAGTQVAGGLIQGAGQKQAQEDQRAYELRMAQEARDRYNANVGTALWSSNQPIDPNTGLPGANAWDPQQAARDINARYAAQPAVATIGSPGLINRNLATLPPGTPMANNNYPVYNPYYANPGRG
ncbi:hypothetical protein UFOVP123_34 [uncultured Caudovirales phage]|uniref:Uncharacterized protein n=1 Tax=uncultured Caudovirales phage TaxID=2100421 RepID=A0A6J5LCA1_9CAUD|nr:hypothetical protein UFOVP123_34 [uncultured Caudovirales phage]